MSYLKKFSPFEGLIDYLKASSTPVYIVLLSHDTNSVCRGQSHQNVLCQGNMYTVFKFKLNNDLR